MRIVRILSIFLLLTAVAAWAQEAEHAGEKHDPKMHEMNMRGDKAMGFSHRVTTHHFRLLAGGGYVQVEANKADDTKSRDAIRKHLQEIEKKFAAGDFSAPEFTHARVPPGVPEMQKLKSEIAYKYEELPAGGRLLMTSKDPKALAAIHDFLKFQIEDHKTGDPVTVQAE
jgi:hypothetical protein